MSLAVSLSSLAWIHEISHLLCIPERYAFQRYLPGFVADAVNASPILAAFTCFLARLLLLALRIISLTAFLAIRDHSACHGSELRVCGSEQTHPQLLQPSGRIALRHMLYTDPRGLQQDPALSVTVVACT